MKVIRQHTHKDKHWRLIVEASGPDRGIYKIEWKGGVWNTACWQLERYFKWRRGKQAKALARAVGYYSDLLAHHRGAEQAEATAAECADWLLTETA